MMNGRTCSLAVSASSPRRFRSQSYDATGTHSMADVSIAPIGSRPTRPTSAATDARPRGELSQGWLALLAGGYLVAVFLSRWDLPAVIVVAASVVILAVRLVARRRIDRIGWAAIVYL